MARSSPSVRGPSQGIFTSVIDFTELPWERMLEEEAQHLPRGVRSSRISVGASRAASPPRVSGSMDLPRGNVSLLFLAPQSSRKETGYAPSR